MQRKWKVLFAVIALGLLGLAIIEGAEAFIIKTSQRGPRRSSRVTAPDWSN